MIEYSERPYDEMAEKMFDGEAVELGQKTRCQFMDTQSCQCKATATVAYPIYQNPRHPGGEIGVLVNLCLDHYAFFSNSEHTGK